MDAGRISGEDIRRDLDMVDSVDDIEYYMAPSVQVGLCIFLYMVSQKTGFFQKFQVFKFLQK